MEEINIDKGEKQHEAQWLRPQRECGLEGVPWRAHRNPQANERPFSLTEVLDAFQPMLQGPGRL